MFSLQNFAKYQFQWTSAVTAADIHRARRRNAVLDNASKHLNRLLSILRLPANTTSPCNQLGNQLEDCRTNSESNNPKGHLYRAPSNAVPPFPNEREAATLSIPPDRLLH
jgi:hypothetical protein